MATTSKSEKRVRAELGKTQFALVSAEQQIARLEGEAAGLRTMALEFTRLAGENTGLRESAKTSAVEFTKVVLKLQAELTEAKIDNHSPREDQVVSDFARNIGRLGDAAKLGFVVERPGREGYYDTAKGRAFFNTLDFGDPDPTA